MSAYVIVQIEVTDPERYSDYLQPAHDSIVAAGGRYLARGGDVTVLEGTAPPGRNVVLEFPDRERALGWYASDTYGAARALRVGAANVSMYVVDGID